MNSPFKRALPWLMFEGAAAMSYETLVGPVYLSAWAGKLGIPAGDLPWLTSLPLLGSAGQLLGVLALSRAGRLPSLKWLCITLTAVARSLWVLAFLIPISKPQSIGVLAALSSAIGLTSTSFWMAWMKGWVPRRFEGRFWGVRARGSTLGVLAAHGLATAAFAFASDLSPFAWLLGLALLSALGSLWILSILPPSAPAPTGAGMGALLRSRSDLRLIGIACLFQAGVSLVGPYFPYYFTHEVGLSPGTVSAWYAMTQLGIALSAIVWGRKWDQGGNPRRLLRVTGVILALSPLPYVIRDASVLRWIGPPEYFVNGLVWAGFQVGLNTILFRTAGRSDPARAAHLFTLMTAAQGVAGALASFAGSALVQALGSFQALWVVGSAIRLVIAWWVLPNLAGSRRPA